MSLREQREEKMQGGLEQAEWVIKKIDFKRLIPTWRSLRGRAPTGGE